MKGQNERPTAGSRGARARASLTTPLTPGLTPAQTPAQTPARPGGPEAALRARIRGILATAQPAPPSPHEPAPHEPAPGTPGHGERFAHLGRLARTFATPWARTLSHDQQRELKATARALAQLTGMPAARLWTPVKRALGVARIDAIPRRRFADARRLLIALAEQAAAKER